MYQNSQAALYTYIYIFLQVATSTNQELQSFLPVHFLNSVFSLGLYISYKFMQLITLQAIYNIMDPTYGFVHVRAIAHLTKANLTHGFLACLQGCFRKLNSAQGFTACLQSVQES